MAERAGFRIGAAVEPRLLLTDPAYAKALVTHFDQITPENCMKLGPLRPTPSRFDFSGADALVDFAEQNGMTVHGHALVWDAQLPPWLVGTDWTRAELTAILRTHIHAVVGRYRGRVSRWDVVNEALDASGRLRDSIWRTGIGDEHVELAFRWAAEADPDARLFYNEYDAEGLGAKSDAVHDLLEHLLAIGAPVHGVGLQMHVSERLAPATPDILANMRRLSALGLEIHVSEMDVRLPVPPTPDALAMQASVYAGVMEACLAVKACRAFSTWGVTDRYSWVPEAFPASGAALLLDEEYGAKPAYDALLSALDAAPKSNDVADTAKRL